MKVIFFLKKENARKEKEEEAEISESWTNIGTYFIFDSKANNNNFK